MWITSIFCLTKGSRRLPLSTPEYECQQGYGPSTLPLRADKPESDDNIVKEMWNLLKTVISEGNLRLQPDHLYV